MFLDIPFILSLPIVVNLQVVCWGKILYQVLGPGRSTRLMSTTWDSGTVGKLCFLFRRHYFYFKHEFFLQPGKGEYKYIFGLWSFCLTTNLTVKSILGNVIDLFDTLWVSVENKNTTAYRLSGSIHRSMGCRVSLRTWK